MSLIEAWSALRRLGEMRLCLVGNFGCWTRRKLVLLGLSMAAGTAALILAFGIRMYLGVCVYGVVLVPVVAFWLFLVLVVP
jgi:hypothetical protein